MPHPKKVGKLIREADSEAKQTNEIKMAIPLLDAIDIKGKEITADALLTQRDFARYLVEDRNADYHFTVKGNQPRLLDDIRFLLSDRPKEPDYQEETSLAHGRIETRKIWTTSEIYGFLDFPYVGQVFVIERERIEKKTSVSSKETIYGICSKMAEKADAKQILETNRGHWCIENSCHYIIDWNYDEDRSTIRTGYGPENVTRLRRFAVSVMKVRGVTNVAQKMRQLWGKTRLVFDYLKMTKNSVGAK